MVKNKPFTGLKHSVFSHYSYQFDLNQTEYFGTGQILQLPIFSEYKYFAVKIKTAIWAFAEIRVVSNILTITLPLSYLGLQIG